MTALLKANLFAAVSALACASSVMAADLKVDARAQPTAVRTEHLRMGTARAPSGATIGANNQYLTRDGKAWLPVMGEFHYTRYPPQYWDDELAKMKAAGVDIVATYIIWDHHEEQAGVFNWSGDRDLRRFVQLAQKHGLLVVVRLGPWAHGEVRFGGTPDWVVNAMPTRGNDPTYMGYVERYWGQIRHQTEGLLWKDGGPIIGVQLENEYNLKGPGRGADHITALKALARKLGFDVPLYTVTGWDGAIYPRGEVLPVFAGYADEPWGVTTGKLPPKEVYAFRFDSRVAGNVGAQTAAQGEGTIADDMADTPFLGAEYGGGLPIMYRRRPLVAPDDVAAMLPVQLGSGANLYGYYMFHGGVNPKGRTTLEEDARLGAFNDLPISNYDFQAPLGAFGEVHPVMGKIRPYHLFLRAFGQRLAPMKVQRPALEPKSADDITTPRYSVRSLGDSGFVFLSNYIRQYAPPVQAATRFEIALPGGTLTFPSKGVDIPTGVHFIWPFNMDLDGARLVWATAQPLTRIEDENAVTYVFAATRGVAAELAIDAASAQVQAKGRTLKADANGRVTATVTPGLGEALRLKTSSGTTIRVVVLTADQAAQASLQDVGGRERLVLSQDDIFATAEGLKIHSTGDPNFRFSVLPALASAPSASLAIKSQAEGVFQTWSAHAVPRVLTAQIKPLREAGVMPKPNVGGTAGVGLQPYPEQYGRSAAWTITLPTDALKGVSDAYLDIDYTGDVARLFDGVELLDDHFYYGPSWSVGLKRFADRLDHPLTLTVLPLRQDAPIYIQDEVRPKFPADGQVAGVRSVTLTPEYELTLTSAKP